MPAQGSGRPLTDRLFGWGRRAEKDAPEAAESAPSAERTVPTKAFSRFLYALSLRESPIVLDLGPIVGGNVTASEKVDIRDNGSVDGDLISPRVAIAEGAHFRGSIDMQRQGGAKGDVKASDVRPSDVKPTSPSPSPSPAPAPQPAKV